MMIPQTDSYAEQLAEVHQRLVHEGRPAAEAAMGPIAYAPRELPRRPALLRRLMFNTFRRDGWRCRYCDGKVILGPVFVLLGQLFPDSFPWSLKRSRSPAELSLARLDISRDRHAPQVLAALRRARFSAGWTLDDVIHAGGHPQSARLGRVHEHDLGVTAGELLGTQR